MARNVKIESPETIMNLREPRLWEHPDIVWAAIGAHGVVGLIRRLFFGFVPGDFTAYLSAADLFVAGLDPYTEARFSTPRYEGFPYNYFPGTLFVIAPMAYMSTVVATCTDWVLRAVLLIFAAKTMQKHIVPNLPIHYVAVLMTLHEPLMIDQLVGNMVTYLFAAWAACLELSKRAQTWRWLGLAFICGVVISFMPFWLIPAGWILVSRSRWRSLIALVLGVLSTPLASFLLPRFFDTFTAHTHAMRDYYFSVDLMSLFAPAYFVALPLAALFAIVWWRRHPSEWVFLLGCVSVPIWPRVATYSYVITLPFSLYLTRRWGLARGLSFSVVTLGPLPWLVRDSGFLPGEQLENYMMFVWVCLAAFLCAYLLAAESRGEAPEEAL